MRVVKRNIARGVFICRDRRRDFTRSCGVKSNWGHFENWKHAEERLPISQGSETRGGVGGVGPSCFLDMGAESSNLRRNGAEAEIWKRANSDQTVAAKARLEATARVAATNMVRQDG